jgi:hypothetical protein
MIKILFCAGNGEVIEYSLNMSIELRIYCKQFTCHLQAKIIEHQIDKNGRSSKFKFNFTLVRL